jgi:hypothetical protein
MGMTPIQHLQRVAVVGALSGETRSVSTETLERDGRKRPSLVRKLIKDGHATVVDDVATPTPQCLEEVGTHPMNLFAIWGHIHEHDMSDRLKMPWVRMDDLTTEQLKEVLANPGDYQFYVIDCDPYQYTTCRFMENAGEVPTGKGAHCYWEGPLTLEQARTALPQVRNQFRSGKGMISCFEIVISSTELEEKIDAEEFNEELERLLRCNLCWALVELGIMQQAEVFVVKEDDEKNEPKLATTKRDGIFPSYTNLGDDPAEWEAVLEDQTEKIAQRIEQLQAQQHLLHQLALKVAKYGGWDKLTTEFRAKLIEYLENRGNEDTSEESDES